MAAGRHGSRFHCLTLLRIMAASLVALVFGATMVLVVLTTLLGPANVRLSVKHGHIQSAGLLWSRQNFPIEHLRRQRFDNLTKYTPANELKMWMSMDAHAPARGAAKVCVSAIGVLDMPHAPYFDGLVHIGTINNTVATGNANKPCKKWRHSGSDSMPLDRWITTNDPLMLCYISQKYGAINHFTVMLKVDMKVLYPDQNESSTPVETHYCWPVTMGNTPQSILSDTVTCKSNHTMDYASIAENRSTICVEAPAILFQNQ